MEENATTARAAVDRVERRNIEAIAKMEETARKERTTGDVIADNVAKFCGSMPFVWIHAVLFAAWIVGNVWMGKNGFDPFPFQFLTLVVSLEAIFLTTFVMVSQNRAQVIADRRNHLDLQINLLSEEENSRMLLLLSAIAAKLEVECDKDDDELREFVAQTQPERLIKEIRERIENGTALSEEE